MTPEEGVPQRLREAVHYAALAPGKRIRPYLVIESSRLLGPETDDAWAAAAAIECVHAFSLIHDDLPAMDDDDVRRGRPTCHRRFDEATAILAGDALLTRAFELLATRVTEPGLARRMIATLAGAAGWAGMIGGQMADLLGEKERPSEELTRSIHERKTVLLFRAACELGALAGRAGDEDAERLCRYGQMVGRAFQIADDLLDVTASAAATGKRTGKDRAAGKQTFVRCVGTERARAAAHDAANAAISALDRFGGQADTLRALARFVVMRDR